MISCWALWEGIECYKEFARAGTIIRLHRLGFGVPYFNTFCLKGTVMKKKFILFSPWLLKSPVEPPKNLIV